MTEHIYALKQGDFVNEYRILQLLGVGGFGMVYLAQHRLLGYQVAIKEFHPSGMAVRHENALYPVSQDYEVDYLDCLKEFKKECVKLLAIDHPNIVKVYDAFDANNTSYMVMHFEDGVPCNEWVFNRYYSDSLQGNAETTPFKWAEVGYIVFTLLSSLEYLHYQCNLVHLDIKPGNIFIRSSTEQPVLIDFGSVKPRDRNLAGRPGKSVLSLPYTEGYAPIEQVHYEVEQFHYGTFTDIYAIGATICSLLTGQRIPPAEKRLNPNVDDPLLPILMQIAKQEGQDFADRVWHAMALYPEHRVQTVSDLRQLLFY